MQRKMILLSSSKCLMSILARGDRPYFIINLFISFQIFSVDDCDNLETLTKLIIAEIALSAGGFLASIIGVYLSFMTICCGPWMVSGFFLKNFYHFLN